MGEPISAARLVEKLTSSCEPISAMFENNKNVSYQLGADHGRMAQFGKLEIIDAYEEKYLLTYAVQGGKLERLMRISSC